MAAPGLLVLSRGGEESSEEARVRLFLAMMSHETNTFSNIPTDRGQFWGHVIGAALNPVGKRIYLLVADQGGNGRPLIHEVAHA